MPPRKEGWAVYDYYEQQGRKFVYFYYYRRKANAEREARRTNRIPGHRAEVHRTKGASPTTPWAEDRMAELRRE